MYRNEENKGKICNEIEKMKRVQKINKKEISDR
jgi:hypothetical protein